MTTSNPDPLPLTEVIGEWDLTGYGLTRAGADPDTGRAIWVRTAEPEEPE